MFNFETHKFKLPVLIGILAAITIIEFPRAMAFLPAFLALAHISATSLTHKSFPALSLLHSVPLLIIIALNFASVLWSVDASVSLERCLKLLPVFFGGFVLMVWAANHKEIAHTPRSYFYAIAVIIAIGALITIYDLNSDETFYRFVRNLPINEKVPSAVYNRGTVIFTLLSFSLLGYFLYVYKSIKILIFPLSALAILMFYTDSQSVQLSLLIGLIFFFAFPYRYKSAWLSLISILALLIITAPFLMPLLYNHAEYINSLPFLGGSMGYAGPRLEIWDFVSRYALDNPFLGHGIEATKVIQDFDSKEIFIEGNTILHPHNFALQLWIEFGMLGAALGIGLITWILWRISTLKDLRCMRVCLATFMAGLSIASTGYGLWQSWWLGTIFTILAVNLYFIYSIEKTNDTERYSLSL